MRVVVSGSSSSDPAGRRMTYGSPGLPGYPYSGRTIGNRLESYVMPSSSMTSKAHSHPGMIVAKKPGR